MPVSRQLLVSLDHMLLRRALANASSAVQANEARAAARRDAVTSLELAAGSAASARRPSA
jgi:hypothetical protein